MLFLTQVAAWTGIAIGTIGAGQRLIILAADRIHARRSQHFLSSSRTMSPRQLRRAWQSFRGFLFGIFGGLFILDNGWGNSIGKWLVLLASSAVTIWDRTLWFKFGLRRLPGG